MTDSNVINSTVTECTFTNVTYIDSVCFQSNLENVYVDPSNISNSVISGDSNITDSTISNSTIHDTDVTDSTVIDSNATNSDIDNSTMTNSEIEDAMLIDANVTDGVLESGTITYDSDNDGIPDTNYTVGVDGGAENLTELINYAPVAVIGFTPAAPNTNQQISFTGSQSSDINGDNITSYVWDFDVTDGLGSDATGEATTHTYTTAGTYTVTLIVEDEHGKQGNTTTQKIYTRFYCKRNGKGWFRNKSN